MVLCDDSINESQIVCFIASRAEVQVLVAAASRPLVQQTVMNDGIRRVLDLDCKTLRDIVGQRTRRNLACQRDRGGRNGGQSAGESHLV